MDALRVLVPLDAVPIGIGNVGQREAEAEILITQTIREHMQARILAEIEDRGPPSDQPALPSSGTAGSKTSVYSPELLDDVLKVRTAPNRCPSRLLGNLKRFFSPDGVASPFFPPADAR